VATDRHGGNRRDDATALRRRDVRRRLAQLRLLPTAQGAQQRPRGDLGKRFAVDTRPDLADDRAARRRFAQGAPSRPAPDAPADAQAPGVAARYWAKCAAARVAHRFRAGANRVRAGTRAVYPVRQLRDSDWPAEVGDGAADLGRRAADGLQPAAHRRRNPPQRRGHQRARDDLPWTAWRADWNQREPRVDFHLRRRRLRGRLHPETGPAEPRTLLVQGHLAQLGEAHGDHPRQGRRACGADRLPQRVRSCGGDGCPQRGRREPQAELLEQRAGGVPRVLRVSDRAHGGRLSSVRRRTFPPRSTPSARRARATSPTSTAGARLSAPTG
jgi:hypothetical protein